MKMMPLTVTGTEVYVSTTATVLSYSYGALEEVDY